MKQLKKKMIKQKRKVIEDKDTLWCPVCKKYVYPYSVDITTDNGLHWEEECPYCGELLSED